MFNVLPHLSDHVINLPAIDEGCSCSEPQWFKCWIQGSIFIQKEGIRIHVEVLDIKHWTLFTLVTTFVLWLGLDTKTLGQGLGNMVWLKIPVLVAAVTNGDGQTFHENYRVLRDKKHGWQYPQVSFKISSGMTQTAVNHLVTLLALKTESGSCSFSPLVQLVRADLRSEDINTQ